MQKQKKKLGKESNKSGNWKEITALKQTEKNKNKFISSVINAENATDFLSGKIQPECNKYCTDRANKLKWSLLDAIEISLSTTIDSDKTYDSLETISEKKTELDFLVNSGYTDHL